MKLIFKMKFSSIYSIRNHYKKLRNDLLQIQDVNGLYKKINL